MRMPLFGGISHLDLSDDALARLDAAWGIVVNGLRYFHPLMRSAKEAGKRVEVRYEPFNMGVAHAFVDGQWLTRTADAFLQVQGRSERE